MVMKPSVLIAVAALLFGGAGGYLVGSGKDNGSEEEGSKADIRSKKAVSSRPSGTVSSSGGPVTRGTRSAGGLREILSEPGQTSRIMSLLEYYSDLDPSEFEGEVQKLQGLPMSQRMLAMNLLFSRWAENDPKGSWERSQQMGFPEMFMAQSQGGRLPILRPWLASIPTIRTNSAWAPVAEAREILRR